MENVTKLCECGCGQPTSLSTVTRADRGMVKGMPLRRIKGHGRNAARYVAPGFKMCSYCWEPHPVDEFRNMPKSPDGKGYYCRECNRKASLGWRDDNPTRSRFFARKQRMVRVYGTTIAEYDRMMEEQKNLCAICGRPEVKKNKDGSLFFLSVDHDHKTGKVRALLCHACNAGMGNFGDDPDRMDKAVAYLRKHAEDMFVLRCD